MGILGNPVLLGSPPLKQAGMSMASVNAEFKADIALTQAGSGDPSTSNIRPITGWSGLNLRYSGRNLVPYLGGQSPTTDSGVTVTPNADGTYSLSGISELMHTHTISDKNNTALKLPVGTYKLSGCPAGGAMATGYWLQVNGGGITGNRVDTGDGATIEVTDPSAGIGVAIGIGYGVDTTGLTFSPMLVPDGADETFVTPKGLTVYQYDWSNTAGEIAAGTLDILTGLLTVTQLFLQFDGTETWSVQSTGANRFYRYINYGITTRNTLARGCSHYPNASVVASTTAQGYYAYTASGGVNSWIQFRPDVSTISDGTAWKNFLAAQAANGTPVTCYFTPVTPLTYQLTPGHIAVTPGDNYIWTDTGPVTLNLSK